MGKESEYLDVSEHRPDTPDAELLSTLITILLLLGKDSEDGMPTNLLDTEVDNESLTYMAMIRSSTIADGTGFGTGIRELATIATAWVEGFLIGAKFAEEKGKHEPTKG